MNFFNSDITLMQAERQLEDFISNYASEEFYLKDIPLTEEDRALVTRMVGEYSKNVYSFDDYADILLLFIVDGYIISKTTDTKGIISALFLNNASHIPQHHMRHLVYLIVNLFMEFDIATFNMSCTSLEDVIHIIKMHARL